jgi:hypothetical protein
VGEVAESEVKDGQGRVFGDGWDELSEAIITQEGGAEVEMTERVGVGDARRQHGGGRGCESDANEFADGQRSSAAHESSQSSADVEDQMRDGGDGGIKCAGGCAWCGSRWRQGYECMGLQ